MCKTSNLLDSLSRAVPEAAFLGPCAQVQAHLPRDRKQKGRDTGHNRTPRPPPSLLPSFPPSKGFPPSLSATPTSLHFFFPPTPLTPPPKGSLLPPSQPPSLPPHPAAFLNLQFPRLFFHPHPHHLPRLLFSYYLFPISHVIEWWWMDS